MIHTDLKANCVVLLALTLFSILLSYFIYSYHEEFIFKNPNIYFFVLLYTPVFLFSLFCYYKFYIALINELVELQFDLVCVIVLNFILVELINELVVLHFDLFCVIVQNFILVNQVLNLLTILLTFILTFIPFIYFWKPS